MSSEIEKDTSILKKVYEVNVEEEYLLELKKVEDIFIIEDVKFRNQSTKNLKNIGLGFKNWDEEKVVNLDKDSAIFLAFDMSEELLYGKDVLLVMNTKSKYIKADSLQKVREALLHTSVEYYEKDSELLYWLT